MADSDDELQVKSFPRYTTYHVLTFHSALSSTALDALKSFYAERDAHAQQFEKLQAAAEEQHASSSSAEPLSMSLFTEDWNESQFWVCFLHSYFLNLTSRPATDDNGSTRTKQQPT